MTEYEWEEGLLQIRQIQAKVAKLDLLTDHPNFMPGFFEVTPIIPHPHAAPPQSSPKWTPARIIAGSAAAVLSIGCFAFVVFMQT